MDTKNNLFNYTTFNVDLVESKDQKQNLDKQYYELLKKINMARNEKEKEQYQNELIKLFKQYKKLAENLKQE